MYETVTTLKRLREWVAALKYTKRFAVDTETTSKDPMAAELVGVSLAYVDAHSNTVACYIPVGHTTGEPQLPLDTVLDALDPLLYDARIAKVLHNAVYDMVVLKKYGIEFRNIDDTQMMSFALEGKTMKHWHGMDDLAPLHLDRTTIAFEEVCPPGLGLKGFQEVRLDHATPYAAEDSDITLNLFWTLRDKLKEADLWHIYAEIDRPTLSALADMKFNGIAVSLKKFRALEKEWGDERDAVEDKLFDVAGPGLVKLTNAGIGDFLYGLGKGQLALEPLKLTAGGAASVDEETLEALEDEHPAIKLILQRNKLEKLLSTYIIPMPGRVNPLTGRVHTNINTTGTNTARYASSDPNLQNIPTANNAKHARQGERIRDAFIASRGRKLICADYSQIELRILAHISKDATLMRAFHEGKDVHAATAEDMFGITAKDVSEIEWGGFRRKAKTINFGLVYGITKFGLAKQLKITPDEAQELIDTYFSVLPGVLDYIKAEKAFVHKHGFNETLWGRRMPQPGIHGNRAAMSHAERAATNAPIQGSAADLIRKAIGRVVPALRAESLTGDLLLQVHDELIFEVCDEEVEATKVIVKRVMEEAGDDIDWLIPIKVDVKHGHSWHEAH